MVDELRDRIQSEVGAAFKSSGDNGIVILPTGTGKSRIIIQRILELAAQYPNGRFIYTCDSIRLRDIDFPNELRKWGAGELVARIERKCYASAYEIKHEDYDVWLADEFDYMLSPEYVKFAVNNRFKHKLLVSATLSGEKRKMALQIAPILYEKKTYEIEGEGIINKSRHLLVKFSLNDDENRDYIRYNEKFKKLMDDDTLWAKNQLKYLSIERKQFLQNLTSSRQVCRSLISYLYKQVEGTRALIFGGSVAQIDTIMPWTYHSENEKKDWLNAFNNGDINYLGVVGKIDRGVNLNNINTIIFESLDASETKMIQRSGRGKRMKQDEILDVYYLIPYFKNEKGDMKPTIVEKWFNKSTTNIDTSNLENFIIPCPTPKIST